MLNPESCFWGVNMKSAIVWFDIPTVDFDRAVAFYSAILGEPIKVTEHMGQKLGLFPMDPNGEVAGDLVPPSEWNVPSATGTRVYLNCEGKLDDVLGRVEPAGGKIASPKFSIGEHGWVAFIIDTEGNMVGLHSR
jgi:predicted enzyme related to lactoylglutathione lyase